MHENCGFEEFEHTADWALRVWAPDFCLLLETAAFGMNHLSELKLERKRAYVCDVALEEADRETLLVNFLSEILYYGEVEQIGFDHFEVHLDGLKLTATLYGSCIASQKKEITAVTSHNLEVRETKEGLLEVEIVFDV